MLKTFTTCILLMITTYGFSFAQSNINANIRQTKPKQRPATQQLIDAAFTNKTDTTIRLVIPVVYDGQKERLAISRKDLVIYMDALMHGCQNTDTLKNVLVRILEERVDTK